LLQEFIVTVYNKKYSSSILIGTLSAASITLVLLVILRYTQAFKKPLGIIEKIGAMSTNNSTFIAYAIFILIIGVIFAVGYGIAYAPKRRLQVG
jgi:uncharacterized BrkB/YihY/UPF0761 family membrane protein